MSDDIVEQLSYYITNEVRMPAGLTVTVISHIEAQQAEIKRLRKAGDALAQGIRTGQWDDALDAWEEMRGR